MFQTSCDAQVILRPAEAIARRVGSGFIVADTFGNMTGSGISSDTGPLPDPFTDLNPTLTGVPWAQNPFTLSINSCGFARFFSNGEVLFGASEPSNAKVDLAGFYLTPRFAPLDSKIGTNGGSVTSGKTALNWTATKGTWKTLPVVLGADAGTALMNTGSDVVATARTIGTLPANRGFRAQIDILLLPGQTALPDARITWGGTWALHLLQGKVARVERLVSKSVLVAGRYVVQSQWQLVRELAGTRPIDARGGKYQLLVFRLAGRLVVSFAGRAFWFLDPGNGDKGSKPQEVTWEAAPLQISGSGVRFTRADFATIKWSASDGTPYEGSVTRGIPHHVHLESAQAGVATCAGWKRGGATAGAVASASDTLVTYVLSMKASKDGIDTPFVDKVSCRFSASWVEPNIDGIDVRFAARAIGISLELGGSVNGSEATLELDRNLLNQTLTGWERYAQMDNPVDIYLKRAGGDYSHVFSGYIFKPEMTSASDGTRTLKLTLRDPLLRLQKVGEVYNSIVDHRYMPLDLLFGEQLQAATANGGYNSDGTPQPAYKGLYFADAVKAILGIALGTEAANSLNGDGNALRYLDADHPPILTPNNDVGGWLQIEALTGTPVAGGGWILPPPFWDDVLSWINQIAQRDRCVFYYGWPPGGESGPPVPIYGRITQILRTNGVRLHSLHDVAIGGSQERLLSTVSVERRPERTPNRFVVAGPEEPGLSGLLPSLRIAEFNLPASDPHAAWHSWEKTYLLKDPLAFLGAEAIGAGLLQQMEGVDLVWPTFEFEGDERIAAGDLVRPDFTGPLADNGLGIDGKTFRVENVSHQIQFTQTNAAFVTSVRPRPLSAVEARAFAHLVTEGGGL